MDIVQRVQSILLKPKEEWVKIKAEPSTIAGLFTSYVMILAAIPAVFTFLRLIFIEQIPMIGHWPVGRALGKAIIIYIPALVAVSLFALIINELAPTFSSTKNKAHALKLAAYSMTPGWLAGVLNIIPWLWALRVVGTLYGLYILYLGLDTPIMETPKNRVPGYMILSSLAAAFLFLLSEILQLALAVRYGRL